MVIMQSRWDGVTKEQYDEVARRVDWNGDVPSGALFHMIGWDGETIQVTDLWESTEDFNNFLVTRMLPALAGMDIAGEPTITIYPAYRVYAPGYEQRELSAAA